MDKLKPVKSKSCVHEVQGGQIMMENKESALDRLARECSAAGEYSDQLLLDLVRDNAGTAFGREHGFSEIRSPADYKRRVPFSEYDDYANAIERMTKGEKNLLTAYPVLLYATTSGSVGVVKKIPMTDRAFRMNRVFANSHMDVLRRYTLDRTGKAYEEGKRVYLSVVSSSHVEDGTPLGVISSHLLLSHKEEIAKRLAGPPETMFGDAELDYTYLKAFYALKERNVTFLVGIFMSSVSDFFSYLEQNWESLCRDIEAGRLDSEKNIPEELAGRLNESLSPDPERAEELRKIFRQGFAQPVVSAVWPRFAALNAIGSGSFAVYTEKVRRFTGDIPISMGVYAASEGMIAVITRMDSAEYTVVPEAGYFEFIPEEDMELPAERLQEHTLSLDELTPGKYYEIIMTNLSGLYRYRIGDVIRVLGYSGQSPVICFAYRKHQMLNITGEKTTEDTIQYAVDRMSEKTGLKVVEWSVYADYSLSPARYVLFIEPVRPLSAEQEHQLRDLLEEGIAEKNESYARHLENGTLSPLKLEILEMQTYRLYRDLLIYKGASANQIKPVHVIDNPVKEKFFFGLAEEEV